MIAPHGNNILLVGSRQFLPPGRPSGHSPRIGTVPWMLQNNLRTARHMTSRSKRRHDQAIAEAEVDYQLELARGASVIASTLSRQNMVAAIEETLCAFVSTHGTPDLDIFTELLRQRLRARNRLDAADALFIRDPALPRRQDEGRTTSQRCNASR
ncbi:hypothetical protein [Paraburkholderia terrae]